MSPTYQICLWSERDAMSVGHKPNVSPGLVCLKRRMQRTSIGVQIVGQMYYECRWGRRIYSRERYIKAILLLEPATVGEAFSIRPRVEHDQRHWIYMLELCFNMNYSRFGLSSHYEWIGWPHWQFLPQKKPPPNFRVDEGEEILVPIIPTVVYHAVSEFGSRLQAYLAGSGPITLRGGNMRPILLKRDISHLILAPPTGAYYRKHCVT